jgi:hypothetical protein
MGSRKGRGKSGVAGLVPAISLYRKYIAYRADIN